MPFNFDLFISYSKHDAPWARRLYERLIARGVDPNRIFLDKEYLKPGVKWNATMSDAVAQARVLVCFWSQHAKDSEWVPHERLKFKIIMEDEEKHQQHTLRKLIPIPLEEVAKPGETDPFSEIQAINDLKEARLYPQEIEGDPNAWSRVVVKVYEAITTNTTHIPVNLLILAMTRDKIDSLDLNSQVAYRDGQSPIKLRQAIKNMGIIADVTLLDRLDPTMIMPDGSPLADILNDLKVTTEVITRPNEPEAVRIVLPNGDSLGSALQQQRVLTVEDLKSWVGQHQDVVLPNGSTLKAVLEARKINDLEELVIKTALRHYYGDSTIKWRPFGSSTAEILTIMNDVQGRYNNMLRQIGSPQPPLQWRVEQFTPQETPRRLASQRSVIVVDPLSLYDGDVFRNLSDLYRSYSNKQALIMAFAPFILPTPTRAMRVLIRDKAAPIYESFFEPELKANTVIAQCGPDIGDQTDIQRWLWQALQPQPGAGPSSGLSDGQVLTGLG